MKKLITLLMTAILVVAACFGLTACGNNTKTQIVSAIEFENEEYAIAGRVDDKAFMSKINSALIAIYNTKYVEVAEKYGLTSELAITSETTDPYSDATDASWDNIVSSGKIIIGYTLFAPIAYKDATGKLTGFDVNLAEEVVAYLNETYSVDLEIEWLEIAWSAKEDLLNGGSIDLIWNGLTATPERAANMCLSVSYLYNKQVVVIRQNDANKYTSLDSLKAKTDKDVIILGAEQGSAGADVIEAEALGSDTFLFTSQLSAYNQLKAGTVDAIIIDSIMANYYVSLDK